MITSRRKQIEALAKMNAAGIANDPEGYIIQGVEDLSERELKLFDDVLEMVLYEHGM